MQSQKPPGQTTPAIDKLTHETDKIIGMASDLQHRGFHAEAVFFAVIAAGRLQAIRALERLRDAGR